MNDKFKTLYLKSKYLFFDDYLYSLNAKDMGGKVVRPETNSTYFLSSSLTSLYTYFWKRSKLFILLTFENI